MIVYMLGEAPPAKSDVFVQRKTDTLYFFSLCSNVPENPTTIPNPAFWDRNHALSRDSRARVKLKYKKLILSFSTRLLHHCLHTDLGKERGN